MGAIDRDRLGVHPPGGLAEFWGPGHDPGRPGRVLGLFAHPDDEVFCVGGTIARCAQAGASTSIVSLTLEESMLPRPIMRELLGTEHFVVASSGERGSQ